MISYFVHAGRCFTEFHTPASYRVGDPAASGRGIENINKFLQNNVVAVNKRAKTEWQFLETFEAGIKLSGDEVKSAKRRGANLKSSWVAIGQDRAARLIGCSISRYAQSSRSKEEYDPERSRVLLLHKKEINSLIGRIKQKACSLIPVSMYIKNGVVKIEIALARSKKQFEKRAQIKKRDIERDIGRRLKR